MLGLTAEQCEAELAIGGGENSSSQCGRPACTCSSGTRTCEQTSFASLSHTEPQLWSPTPAVNRRDGEQASGRDRGKSRAERDEVLIQTHSGSSVKAG